MTAPDYECPWPTDSACFSSEWDTFSYDVRDRSIALASATLRRLTAYQVGNCPVTVRPCLPRNCGCGMSMYSRAEGWWMAPQLRNGFWYNCGNCACTPLCSVDLPAPVGRIDSVKIDGADFSDYILDGSTLIATTDDCPFPICQNLSKPDTEVGTFSVTYLNAWPVDEMGAYACGVLAMEFAKACTSGKCRLPTGVTAITRQGVSMNVVSGSFPGGQTGIREVDAWVALYNPQARVMPTKMWAPGAAL